MSLKVIFRTSALSHTEWQKLYNFIPDTTGLLQRAPPTSGYVRLHEFHGRTVLRYVYAADIIFWKSHGYTQLNIRTIRKIFKL